MKVLAHLSEHVAMRRLSFNLSNKIWMRVRRR